MQKIDVMFLQDVKLGSELVLFKSADVFVNCPFRGFSKKLQVDEVMHS